MDTSVFIKGSKLRAPYEKGEKKTGSTHYVRHEV